MQPLIYYPTFEPPEDIWLKFALLYFEEFRPIIPVRREHLVSDNFRRLKSETDLINPISPTYDHGAAATEKAIEEVERCFASTYEPNHLLNRLNIIRRWKDRSQWDFEIYSDKFSGEWGHYCREKEIGQITDQGIILSEELAFLFMSYLANEMAYTENTAIVTDNNNFDRFTNARRLNSIETNRRNQFAKGIIDLKVPVNLAQISIQNLIRFRKDHRQQIAAFNAELDKIQNKIGNHYSERDFIEDYQKINIEIQGIVAGLGIGMVSVALSAYMLLQNPSHEFADYIKMILEPTGIAIGGYYALNKALADTRNEKYCKKYLVSLSKLSV